MQILRSVLVISFMLAAASCAHPQYWVKGLMLPPGSTEKSRTENKITSSDAKPKFGEQPDGTLLVYFDSSESWEQVASYIGDGLKEEGFTEASSMLAGMGDSLAGKLPGGGLVKDMAKGFLDYSRTYTKDDYSVTLTNMKSVMESKVFGQLKKLRKDAPPPAGDYMLLVSKHKGFAANSAPATPNLQAPGK